MRGRGVLYTILFDTNILLSMVIPYDIWKHMAENIITGIKDYVNEGKAELITMGLIQNEIKKKSSQISYFISAELRRIFSSLTDIKKPLNKNKLKEIENAFQQRILNMPRDRNRFRNRNLLVFAEEYLIDIFTKEKGISIENAFIQCINHFNDYYNYMIQKVNNYLVNNNINLIKFPQNKSKKHLIYKIKKSLYLKNNADAKILSFYIFHLQEEKKNGLFITFDFNDLLKKSNGIEKQYNNQVKITRPSYIKCYFN